MKIVQAHFKHMEAEINKVLTQYGQDNLVKEYEQGSFSRSNRTKDLQKRFCFDLAYGAGLNKFFSQTLYEYANDDHIYTALKRICPTVTRKF